MSRADKIFSICLYESFVTLWVVYCIVSAESLYVRTSWNNEMWLIFQYVTKSWGKHLFVGFTRDVVMYWQMPVTYSKSLPPQRYQLLEAHRAYLSLSHTHTHTHTHTYIQNLLEALRHLILIILNKEHHLEVLNDIQQPQKALRKLKQAFCKPVFPLLWF